MWRVVAGDLPETRKMLGIDRYWVMNPRRLSWHELILSLSHKRQQAVHEVRQSFVRFVFSVAGQTCSPFCQFIDVGTDSPTSDIDVTVVNTRASLVVRLAAELFEALFLRSPSAPVDDDPTRPTTMSSLLDVNVYSNIYYDTCGGSMQPKHQCPRTPSSLNASQAEQAVWALMRVPKHVLGRQSTLHWRALCSLAETLRASVKGGCAGGVQADSVSFLAAIENSERLLSELGEKAEKVRGFHNESFSSWSETRDQYLRAVSAVRCMETDAYISYGAFAHVVLVMQAGKKGVNLTPLEYIASFFDNLGFLCGCKRVDTHAAKYLVRCFDAEKRHDRTSRRKTNEDIDETVSLASALVKARRKGADADVLQPMLASFIRSAKGLDEIVHTLKPTIVRFASEVYDALVSNAVKITLVPRTCNIMSGAEEQGVLIVEQTG